MKKNGVNYIVRTALLLAIAVLFQEMSVLWAGLGKLPAQIITGSLINLTLFVSAGILGWKGGSVIAVLSPLLAALRGELPTPILAPFVAVGNLALVVAFVLFEKKTNSLLRQYISMGAAAVIKFAVLYLLIALFFVQVIFPLLNMNKAIAVALQMSFSWPQLVTAAIGGVIAVPVIKKLRAALSASDNR